MLQKQKPLEKWLHWTLVQLLKALTIWIVKDSALKPTCPWHQEVISTIQKIMNKFYSLCLWLKRFCLPRWLLLQQSDWLQLLAVPHEFQGAKFQGLWFLRLFLFSFSFLQNNFEVLMCQASLHPLILPDIFFYFSLRCFHYFFFLSSYFMPRHPTKTAQAANFTQIPITSFFFTSKQSWTL